LQKEAKEALQKRRQARDSDWAKLGPLLDLSVIAEPDKARWSNQFLRDYWRSPGIEPAMAKAIAPHVRHGPTQRALQASARRASRADAVAAPAALAGSSAAKSAARAGEGAAGVEWVQIPGGKFWMGSHVGDETPAHGVMVKAFQMARTLVTNKQYRACVYAGACTAPDDCGDSFKGDDQPVVGVDWNQAKAFSEWVGGRLPSEAEWEYAARSAGRYAKYPWGDAEATCERAVIDQGGNGCGRGGTWPVCSKAAGNTEQGLCDMAGNAWEWVQDWYHDSYNGAPSDGSAWEAPVGSNRVFRGGSWYRDASLARATHRDYDVPGVRRAGISFRPVR
jgi:formylglycine-generating enzyme required for sulfatase activity